jgi:UDP-N-acetylmuramoylalanine--D-glutamate ligase
LTPKIIGCFSLRRIALFDGELPAKKIKAAIVIGLDREPVLAALALHAPTTKVFEVNVSVDQVMTEVVNIANSIAVAGDAVLLAPAAASMDQFKDYADRGNAFAQAIKKEVF